MMNIVGHISMAFCFVIAAAAVVVVVIAAAVVVVVWTKITAQKSQ